MERQQAALSGAGSHGAPPAPTQAQGPGQRKAGESTRPDERPDPLAQLAKELGAAPVPIGAS